MVTSRVLIYLDLLSAFYGTVADLDRLIIVHFQSVIAGILNIETYLVRFVVAHRHRSVVFDNLIQILLSVGYRFPRCPFYLQTESR